MHAYDQSTVQYLQIFDKPITGKHNRVLVPLQVFVGRIAMIGFAAALVGEIQTGGKGPLGQLALPIQTPVNPDVAGVSATFTSD